MLMYKSFYNGYLPIFIVLYLHFLSNIFWKLASELYLLVKLKEIEYDS